MFRQTTSSSSSSNSTPTLSLPKSMILKGAKHLYIESIVFELIQDNKFESGHIYRSKEIIKKALHKAHRVNLASTLLIQKQLIHAVESKWIVSISDFLAWEQIQEHQIKDCRRPSRGTSTRIMKQFYESTLLTGWYEFIYENPVDRVNKLVDTCRLIFGIEKAHMQFSNGKIFNLESSEHDFIFYYDEKGIYINKQTADIWNGLLKLYPKVGSAPSYRTAFNRKDDTDDTDNFQTYLAKIPAVQLAYGQWRSFYHPTSTPEVEKAVINPNEAFNMAKKSFITEPCEENNNWFELRVPHKHVIEIASELMKYAKRTYHLNFTNPFPNTQYRKSNTFLILNPNDRDHLYIFPDPNFGRLIFSRATASTWNLAVEAKWHPECNTHTLIDGIAHPNIIETTTSTSEPRIVVDETRSAALDASRTKTARPKTREEMEAETKQKNFERAAQVFQASRRNTTSSTSSQPTSTVKKLPGISKFDIGTGILFPRSPISLGSPTREISTETHQAPTATIDATVPAQITAAGKKRSGASCYNLGVGVFSNQERIALPAQRISLAETLISKFNSPTRAYLRCLNGEPKANLYLGRMSLNEEQTAKFSDPITRSLIEVPVKFKDKLYDLNSLINLLEGRCKNDIGILSHEEIKPAEDEFQEIKTLQNKRLRLA